MKDKNREREERRIETYHRLAEMAEDGTSVDLPLALADIKVARVLAAETNESRRAAEKARDLISNELLRVDEKSTVTDPSPDRIEYYWRAAAVLLVVPPCAFAYLLAERVAYDLAILF